MAQKYVYTFGAGSAEGRASMKGLLGGKGANLAEMSHIGLPVPAGFTISTEACKFVSEHNGTFPEGLDQQIDEAVQFLERAMDAKFGSASNPLLCSVRSGAAVSMPGMMDTVLNLGINDEVALGLEKKSNNPRFAWDTYRRFIDMFSDVVMGVHHDHFEEAIDTLKTEVKVNQDSDLTADHQRELVKRFKQVFQTNAGKPFPTDAREQLVRAIRAVFSSWDSERAVKYRAINQISGLTGTAVTVQAMVFGNMGDTSGTGVCFTRNPSNGTPELYGEYLINAQGEDVVAGIRTPLPISTLKDKLPAAYTKLLAITKQLETHYRNMQDIEFTVQDGTLYMLQTRSGKRTGQAAVRIAVDMVAEKLVSVEEAVLNLVEPRHIDQILHPRFEDEASYRDAGKVIAKGLPASPGAAVGRVVFTAEEAEAMKMKGEKVILVRIETSPEDVGGMHAAEGILTARGGMTSHAAVVARGWGKPCVAGCSQVVIDYKQKTMRVGEHLVKDGDWVSLNGGSGEVMVGKLPLVGYAASKEFDTFMGWVDAFKRLGVRTNADTPNDAKAARAFGAKGIGLCRTEHMFFEGDRIKAMREMIIADTLPGRQAALEKLLPYQRDDFIGIFEAMDGLPVTIRLLDPPLHEFLPNESDQQEEIARDLKVPAAKIRARVLALHETNPMLGHRGCRLGITFPEITQMQARAIFEAACIVKKKGKTVLPEVMVPLVGTVEEMKHQGDLIRATAKTVMAEQGIDVPHMIGTMIEVPRAALMADTIAAEAEFFSFGTNDLTQMTLGYSRDDVSKFLPAYLDGKILTEDPFQSIDVAGVGQLVRMAVERGKKQRPTLKIGICGEHGGDAASIQFFHSAGLDYVSCSPFRVPVARLAAAQAMLKEKKIRAQAGE